MRAVREAVSTYRCPDCRELITYHGDDQQEHGHARGCEGAQVCDCPPGFQHLRDCDLAHWPDEKQTA